MPHPRGELPCSANLGCGFMWLVPKTTTEQSILLVPELVTTTPCGKQEEIKVFEEELLLDCPGPKCNHISFDRRKAEGVWTHSGGKVSMDPEIGVM